MCHLYNTLCGELQSIVLVSYMLGVSCLVFDIKGAMALSISMAKSRSEEREDRSRLYWKPSCE